jgi:vacuolar-type H+-ATPase subunit I/STV1
MALPTNFEHEHAERKKNDIECLLEKIRKTRYNIQQFEEELDKLARRKKSMNSSLDRKLAKKCREELQKPRAEEMNADFLNEFRDKFDDIQQEKASNSRIKKGLLRRLHINQALLPYYENCLEEIMDKF